MSSGKILSDIPNPRVGRDAYYNGRREASFLVAKAGNDARTSLPYSMEGSARVSGCPYCLETRLTQSVKFSIDSEGQLFGRITFWQACPLTLLLLWDVPISVFFHLVDWPTRFSMTSISLKCGEYTRIEVAGVLPVVMFHRQRNVIRANAEVISIPIGIIIDITRSDWSLRC
jgi:hypothetical protein